MCLEIGVISWRRLDERFFFSSQGLWSELEHRRLASVYDLLHVGDAWAVADPGSDNHSATGRLQEVLDTLISFVSSEVQREADVRATGSARSAAFRGICARLIGPTNGSLGMPTIIGDPGSNATPFFWKPRIPTIRLSPAWVELDLSGVNLSGLSVENANLSGLVFQRANMEFCRFIDSTLDEANFRGANLQSLTATGSFQRCNFTQAYVPGLILHGDATDSDFTGCELIGANFQNSCLNGCSFANAVVHAVDFTGAQCDPAVFSDAYADRITIFPDGSSLQNSRREDLERRWPGIRFDFHEDDNALNEEEGE